MHYRQIAEIVHIVKSYQQLEKAGLKSNTETMIITAQKQALDLSKQGSITPEFRKS